jgi:glutathione S-transferase
MALQFYFGSGSPFVWRVHLALEHKRVAYELKQLSFSAGDHKKPEFSRLNPRHKVPAIVDEGFVLYESSAILEYLDERFPDAPSLFPGGLRERAIIRRMIREIDSVYVASHDRLTAQLFFTASEQWNVSEISAGVAGCKDELAFFEQEMRGDFLAGAISAADFTLYPFVATIVRFEKKKPDLGLSTAIGPKLNAWRKRIEALPYYDKTHPPHWRTT